LARLISTPSFLPTKRSRIIAAAAGTLTLATAISATALAFSAGSSAAASGASDAFMAMPAVHASVTQQGDTMTQAQSLASSDQVRFAQGAKQQAYDVAVAKAAAAKAAEAKAAAKAAAERHAAAVKAAAAAAAAGANQQAAQSAQTTATQSTATPSGSPEQIAQQMLGQFGWSASQFSCLQPLWYHESGWNVTAENPGSGAYGIPQALPGSQMASAGPDWQTNAATQIKWGLTYIQSRYGSPCGAWAHEQADNWY
jgi:hypothetical protein